MPSLKSSGISRKTGTAFVIASKLTGPRPARWAAEETYLFATVGLTTIRSWPDHSQLSPSGRSTCRLPSSTCVSRP